MGTWRQLCFPPGGPVVVLLRASQFQLMQHRPRRIVGGRHREHKETAMGVGDSSASTTASAASDGRLQPGKPWTDARNSMDGHKP
ncbi:hypothetical protein C4D60_Mb07t06380 [Musa balbisiana]|uniref:Uncharacterized protein n=1 Tax=Musa balbisiana TaxID=52838 RepID=A0A4S8JDK7_MUSBA|nr:hypothetical protein C4D60_Mb07t06380 [Musa balbisiana]